MAIKTTDVLIPENAPYRPPVVTQDLVWSLKGLNAGDADAGQQTLALHWIITELCKTYDFPFRPGENDRDTNVAIGKMFVGQQLVAILNMPNEKIAKLPRLRPMGESDDEIPNR